MNGVKSGALTSEGQLTAVLALFTGLHDQIGLELNEATLGTITALGIAYIAGRSLVKITATWKGGSDA